MNKTKTYIVIGILFITLCVVGFLIFRANQLEQYVMAPGHQVNHLEGFQIYLHIIQKLISNI
jgi:hypothetical protein